MNNNKKILKRSSAAFLAALNIFNFAGGSSKAVNPWNVVKYVGTDPERVSGLKEFLDLLENVDFEQDVNELNNGRILEYTGKDVSNLAKFYKLKCEEGKKVLFLDFCGNASFKNSADNLNLLAGCLSGLLKDDVNKNFIVYKIENFANTQRKCIKKALSDSNEDDEDGTNTVLGILGENNINFIDIDSIAGLKFYCRSFEADEAEKAKKEAEKAKKEAEKAKKEAKKEAEEEAEENLKAANSRAKKLGVVAGLGWIGTFVSLGYVFQNELKNACGTVYKKVLELKNKMLG